MKTEATDPISPTTEVGNNGEMSQGFGLTKREYFAGMALCGLNHDEFKLIYNNAEKAESVARRAVMVADALITALNGKEAQQ